MGILKRLTHVQEPHALMSAWDFERTNRRYARHLKVLGERPDGALCNLKSAICHPAQRGASRQLRTFKPELPGANLCCIGNKGLSWAWTEMERDSASRSSVASTGGVR